MEKASPKNMETGNLLFGNARGEYAIDRSLYEDIFWAFMRRVGLDTYGRPEPDSGLVQDEHEDKFENDVFLIRPYYWGDDEEKADRPNFVYKPGNVEIKWYKYPLRDSYCSHNLTQAQFEAMLDACAVSVGK